MENFKELKSIWNKQPAIAEKLVSKKIEEKSFQKIKEQKAKHFCTIGILVILIFVLIYYYSSIYNTEIVSKIKGLGLMILVIVIRVILEIVSIIKIKKIDFALSLKKYSYQLLSFYKFRRAVHLIFTPIIYLLYIVGFISLLPLFKENLSKGFYLYVLLSGIGFFLFFSYFLLKIILKDLNELKFLQTIDEE